jgi:hypothetical protein
MKLVLKDCTIEQLNRYPGEEGVTQVLKVKALLTRTLAGQLRCQGLCFAENNMPRRFEDFIKLPLGHMGACNIDLGAGTAFAANQARGFRVKHAKENGDGPSCIELYCSLHFDGSTQLAPWMDVVNKAQFVMTLTPPNDWQAQGELPFEGSAPDEEPIETHLTGDALAAHKDRTGPQLAPAATMGGTHQHKNRTQIGDPA